MGYRPKYTAKEMAALKYALPKEARAVLKNSIKWEQGEDQQDPALTLKKLGNYHAGTKNIIHERVVEETGDCCNTFQSRSNIFKSG